VDRLDLKKGMIFMYETYATPSWEMEWAGREKSRYECEYCGVELYDNEVFLVSGKPFCGCCKDN
jgi:formylmethanofuran dehydrogenase subunit E